MASDDGVVLDVLAPSEPLLADTGDDVNENSVVAMLRYRSVRGEFRVLFMGDAGKAREAELLADGADLHADLLKVGHHGSQYASTRAFLRPSRRRSLRSRLDAKHLRASRVHDVRIAKSYRSSNLPN
jgi:beta-lactamase superfamily II metal-dependent hydrolase